MSPGGHMTGNNPRIEAPVRVALVEQYAMVAETFAFAIRPICTPIPVLVEPRWTAHEILAAVLEVRADIAVLHLDTAVPDYELPIKQLASAGVTTTVLTDRADETRHGDYIERGAQAVLSTELGLRQLVNVIARVSAQEPAMAPGELERLRTAARGQGSRPTAATEGVDRLSEREGQVLRYLMAGLTPARIAQLDWVAETTVRTQVRSVLAKLGVSSQLAAVALAYRAGWRPQRTSVLTRLSPAG